MTQKPGLAAIPMVLLLRDARDVYREALRQALERAGCDDVPRNGTYVFASLDHSDDVAFTPQGDVVASLRLSKQMASQLIDTLVLRNYLERRNDPVDRRRMEVRLTARGRRAAIAIHTAIDAVEAAVADSITTDELHGLRAGLAAFGAIAEPRHDHANAGTG